MWYRTLQNVSSMSENIWFWFILLVNVTHPLSVLKILEKFKAASKEAHLFLRKDIKTETIC